MNTMNLFRLLRLKDNMISFIPMIFFVAIVIMLESYFRLHLLPIPVYDAPIFFSIAINFAAGKGLVFPFTSPVSTVNGPFTWHGWLYPYLIGGIARIISPSFLGVNLSEILLILGAAILFAILIYPLKNVHWMVKLCAISAVVGASISSSGRPETLASFLIILGIVSVVYNRNKWTNCLCLSLIWGALGIAHPTVALLASPLVLGYMVISNKSLKTAWFGWIIIGISAVMIALLATITLYPYPLVSWIGGLWAHAKGVASRNTPEGFFFYFLFSPLRFMQGMWVPAALYSIYLLTSQNRKWWIAGIILLSIIMFGCPAVRNPTTNYNLFAFIPFFVWISILAANRLDLGWKAKSIRVLVIIVGVFAIATLGRRYVVLQYSLSEGTRPQALVEEVKSIPMDQKIAMDESLKVACFSPDEWSRFERNMYGPGRWDYFIVRQSSTAMQYPAQKNGYSLISNNFRRSLIYIGPIRVANTDLSYNYAIYRRLKDGQ